MEEDDCDCHLAGEDEEWEVEVVAGDDGLVEEVHAEAADEVEGGRRDRAGLALLLQHRALRYECQTSRELLHLSHFLRFN